MIKPKTHPLWLNSQSDEEVKDEPIVEKIHPIVLNLFYGAPDLARDAIFMRADIVNGDESWVEEGHR